MAAAIVGGDGRMMYTRAATTPGRMTSLNQNHAKLQ